MQHVHPPRSSMFTAIPFPAGQSTNRFSTPIWIQILHCVSSCISTKNPLFKQLLYSIFPWPGLLPAPPNLPLLFSPSMFSSVRVAHLAAFSLVTLSGYSLSVLKLPCAGAPLLCLLSSPNPLFCSHGSVTVPSTKSISSLPPFSPKLAKPRLLFFSVLVPNIHGSSSAQFTNSLTASLSLINKHLHSHLQSICNYTKSSQPSSPSPHHNSSAI